MLLHKAIRRGFLCLCLFGAIIAPASAQDLYVGFFSSGNTTNISSGTNSYNNTIIGNLPGADSNQLNVLNSGTVLTNTASLFIGNAGSGNTLVITNQGLVIVDSTAAIGSDVTSSNNSVLVTGASSTLSIAGSVGVVGLTVGNSGSSNSLTISNGGSVVNFSAAIGYEADSSNNIVTVTETGSTWTNRFELYI